MQMVSVIVPVLNERPGLDDFRKHLFEVLEGLPQVQWEVVFVDDGSSDGSKEWIEIQSREDTRVKGIFLTQNFGSHGALQLGLAESRGDAGIILSADLQDPPSLIPDLVRRWTDGCPLVLAVRSVRRDDGFRRFFAWVFYGILRRTVSPQFPKGGFDFSLLDRRVIEELTRSYRPRVSLFVQMVGLGIPFQTVPYERGERLHGKSRWTYGQMVRLAMDSLLLFSSRGRRGYFFTGITLLVLFFLLTLGTLQLQGTFLGDFLLLGSLLSGGALAIWSGLLFLTVFRGSGVRKPTVERRVGF